MDDYGLTLPGDRPEDDEAAPLFQAVPDLPAAVGSGVRVGKRRGQVVDNKDPNLDPDLGIPLPDVPEAPGDAMSFGENVRGTFRSGSLEGVVVEFGDPERDERSG